MSDGHSTPAPLLLALDASTYEASVALLAGGRALAEARVAMRGQDEERLMPAVADVLARGGVPLAALDAIVCGGGPGSFTSLRIAGSIAKGLAHAAGVPLVAVPSLALVAWAHARAEEVAGPRPHDPQARRWPGEQRRLATMDAMRGERYAAIVTLASDGDERSLVVQGYEYLGVQSAAAVDALAQQAGALPCDAATHAPDAAGVAAFALALADGRVGSRSALALAPVDLAGWEPDYGRKAEAQVKWEVQHGRDLPTAATTHASPDPSE